jgi:hypothetical protein
VRRGLVDRIFRSWRDPRGAMQEEVAAGLGENRALVHLMLACGLFFVASLPTALRQARGIEADDPVSAAIAAHLFAWGALAPLAAYGLAAVVHLAARGFGAQIGFLAARAAFFWSALALAPFAVLAALVDVAAELAAPRVLPWIGWLDYAGLALWLWVFSGSLAVAEGFERTGRVAAVVAAGFAGVAGLLAVLAGGDAA